ncbi:MAG TPA: DUF4214 domain-containing protein [Pyrinomonadaceae bacterium]|nr:DUF4214 domain-containing protein [Pyrinomonadaceae bacterium]
MGKLERKVLNVKTVYVRASRKILGPNAVRELLVFVAFLILTIAMTWPWVMHLRDAASDAGDPYYVAWNLWWDYHQTFTDPLRLFHANIFYPYSYTLAFSEHNYGSAIFCFPLFAIGLRPLTVTGIATLLGFAFSAYGAFRLTRTLTESTGIAWVSGIAFGFVPYRFGQLAHLMYLSSGWIPILLEALVLFMRRRSWGSATWLGVSFFLNALTSVHWFVLTLIPLGLTILLMLIRNGGWRDTRIWFRGLSALTVAALSLIPFLLPYVRVANLYGFTRSVEEARFFSARLIHWFVPSFRNRMWHGLNAQARAGEKELFPGFVPLLLMLASVFLVRARGDNDNLELRRIRSGRVAILLDLVIINCGVLFVTISGYGFFKLRILGVYLFRLYNPYIVLAIGGVALIARLMLAYPVLLTGPTQGSLLASIRSERRSDAFWIGIIWTVTGFAGSLGMNCLFYRTLYEFVPFFRSIRVPARWAMICYVGLVILAGLGTSQLAQLLGRHWCRVKPVAVYVIIAAALLVEQRVAPLELIRGAVDPDALTMWFKQTPMAGGIVELPSGYGLMQNYGYVLRAADHGRPLVTAVSGFPPVIPQQIQSLTEASPIPGSFLDLLESIPCSYLVIHNKFLDPAKRLDMQRIVGQGILLGRLRYIRTYGEGDDLYSVTKTEPNVVSEATLPFQLPPDLEPNWATTTELPPAMDDADTFVRTQYHDVLGREADSEGLRYWSDQIQRCGPSAACLAEWRLNVAAAFFLSNEFQETALFIHAFYRGILGRQAVYEEFVQDREELARLSNIDIAKSKLLQRWVNSSKFAPVYPLALNTNQFVDTLLKRVKDSSGVDLNEKRQQLLSQMESGRARETVVREVIEDPALSRAEYNRTFVLMLYFAYLKRDPDPTGYRFWLEKLDRDGPKAYRPLVRSFITSKEYVSRFAVR